MKRKYHVVNSSSKGAARTIKTSARRLASFVTSAVGGILVLGPIFDVAAQRAGPRTRRAPAAVRSAFTGPSRPPKTSPMGTKPSLP